MRPIDLQEVIGNNYTVEKYNALVKAFDWYKINTPLRKAHFLAQVLHESGGLNRTVENLNYSSQGLRNTWPNRFTSDALANNYARKPEMIANFVYQNRMGNGPYLSGDGWKYRGRGWIQITGKSAYIDLTKDFQQPFSSKPDMVALLPWAALTAGWFWNKRNLNQLADVDDLQAITKKINGGLNGIGERRLYLEKCKLALL